MLITSVSKALAGDFSLEQDHITFLNDDVCGGTSGTYRIQVASEQKLLLSEPDDPCTLRRTQLTADPFVYDFLGDHTSDTYSYTTGTLTISYGYNGAARPTQVTSSLVDAQHPATLVSGISYTPAGAISQLTFGNGLVEARSYNNRLQPTQLRTYNPNTGTDTLNMSYGFNAGTADNGNVASWSATGQQTFSRTYLYL